MPEPGQHWVLQLRVCVLSPLQFLPPFAGTGLSQLLLRLLLPPPQLALQADQALQLPQPPFTGKQSRVDKYISPPQLTWHCGGIEAAVGSGVSGGVEILAVVVSTDEAGLAVGVAVAVTLARGAGGGGAAETPVRGRTRARCSTEVIIPSSRDHSTL